MTKRTYTTKSGDEWSWNETKELKEYSKRHGNTNRGGQDPSKEVKKN